MSDTGRASRPWRIRLRASLLTRVLLASVVAVLLLEVTLRLLSPLEAVRAYLYHAKDVQPYADAESLPELLELTLVGHRPLTTAAGFVLNSRSLRTWEYTTEKPDDVLRILAIGNSYTYSSGGVPLELMWHQQLRQALAERSTRPVEVINLGLPAANLSLSRRMWELEGAQLDADLVVFAFVVASGLSSSEQAQRDRTWVESLVMASHLCRFVSNLARLFTSRPEQGWEGEEDDDRYRVHDVGGVPLSEIRPGRVPAYDGTRPELSASRFAELQRGYFRICTGWQGEQIYQEVAEGIRAFRDDVEATGARFLLLIIPAQLQTDPALREDLLVEFFGDSPRPADLAFDRPQRFLANMVKHAGIRSLDLLERFAEVGGAGLYRPLGTHWNLEGNTLAAQELVDHLTRPAVPGRPSLWQRLQARR